MVWITLCVAACLLQLVATASLDKPVPAYGQTNGSPQPKAMAPHNLNAQHQEPDVSESRRGEPKKHWEDMCHRGCPGPHGKVRITFVWTCICWCINSHASVYLQKFIHAA